MRKTFNHSRYWRATKPRVRDIIEELNKRRSDFVVSQEVCPDGRPFVHAVAVGRSAEVLLDIIRQMQQPQTIDDVALQAVEPDLFPIGCLVLCVSEGSQVRGQHGVVVAHGSKIEVRYCKGGEAPEPFRAYHVGTDLQLVSAADVPHDQQLLLWYAGESGLPFEEWQDKASQAYEERRTRVVDPGSPFEAVTRQGPPVDIWNGIPDEKPNVEDAIACVEQELHS